MKIKFLFTFSILLLNSFVSIGQKGTSFTEFDVISRQDGLGHNQVECVFQDSYGFMWFGTRNGLCKYDGFGFINYTSSSDSTSISGNRILSIAEDLDGNLWVGTFQDGINMFNHKSGNFKRYTSSSELGKRINKISVLNDGSLWICTNNGLGRYNAHLDNFSAYQADPLVPGRINSNRVFDLIETRSGEVYVV